MIYVRYNAKAAKSRVSLSNRIWISFQQKHLGEVLDKIFECAWAEADFASDCTLGSLPRILGQSVTAQYY
jgi:hypothetical protein